MNIILKIRKYLRVTKLKNQLHDLKQKRKSIDWQMQMANDLTQKEIDFFNSEDTKVSSLIKVKKAQLSFYGLAMDN